MILIEEKIVDALKKLQLELPENSNINLIHTLKKEEGVVYCKQIAAIRYIKFNSEKELLDKMNVGVLPFTGMIRSSPGKLLKHLYPDASSILCEKFTNLLKPSSGVIKIREDVTEVYNKDSPHSCMSGIKLDFYESNGIKVLVYQKKEEILARALVWENVFSDRNKEFTMLDRVYDIDGSHIKWLREYALSMGWIISQEWGASGNRTTFAEKDRDKERNLFYPLKCFEPYYLPYMDTMFWMNPYGNLSNIQADITYRNTKGGGGKWPIKDIGLYPNSYWHPDFQWFAKKDAVMCEVDKVPIPKKMAILDVDKYYNKNKVSSCKYCGKLVAKCIVSSSAENLKKIVSLSGELSSSTVCDGCVILITHGEHSGNYARTGGKRAFVVLQDGTVWHKKDPHIVELYDGTPAHRDDDITFLEDNRLYLYGDKSLNGNGITCWEDTLTGYMWK